MNALFQRVNRLVTALQKGLISPRTVVTKHSHGRVSILPAYLNLKR